MCNRLIYSVALAFVFTLLAATTGCIAPADTWQPGVAENHTLPPTQAGVTAVATPTPTVTELPAIVPPTPLPATDQPTPDVTVVEVESATLPPQPTISPTLPVVPSAAPQNHLTLTIDDVFLYPMPEIYAGDRVTFQVIAGVPDHVAADAVTVHILVNGEETVTGTLGWRNLAGDAVGLFQWAWDTTDQVGEHTIEVILDRDNLFQIGEQTPSDTYLTMAVAVYDPATLSPIEANAAWITAETNCCLVHVVSGTAASRDLPDLLPAVETAVRQAASRLQEEPNRKFDVYFIDRVIGQGGYAGSSMVVSYVDRQYASSGLHEVLVHEAVHLLDRQFAPQRIVFLAEGVAVWASDGHYKPEDLNLRAAALLEIDRYIPLSQLIDDFYPAQHEIGYLQAAAFVSYLIDTYGWHQFRAFYSNATREDGATMSAAIDANLQQYFGVTLLAAEANWLAYLQEQPRDRQAILDLQTTVRYYDTMRQYQRAYDPGAYFLTAWLPFPQELQSQGNPADLTRRPRAEINVVLEVMFHAADQALRAGDYILANALLDSITRTLDNDGIFLDPLSQSYLNVVRVIANRGYEAQRVVLDRNQATVWGTLPTSNALTRFLLVLEGRDWVLAQ